MHLLSTKDPNLMLMQDRDSFQRRQNASPDTFPVFQTVNFCQRFLLLDVVHRVLGVRCVLSRWILRERADYVEE